MLIYVFNVLLIKKICTKENHQNQRHYTFSRITTKKERKEIIKKKLHCHVVKKLFIILQEFCFHFLRQYLNKTFIKNCWYLKKNVLIMIMTCLV